jgi:hypothetical protein
MGDVLEFAIPCHPFVTQIRHLLSLDVFEVDASEARRQNEDYFDEPRRVPFVECNIRLYQK